MVPSWVRPPNLDLGPDRAGSVVEAGPGNFVWKKRHRCPLVVTGQNERQPRERCEDIHVEGPACEGQGVLIVGHRITGQTYPYPAPRNLMPEGDRCTDSLGTTRGVPLAM